MLRMWEPGKRLKLVGIIVCIGVLLLMLTGGLILWLGSRDIDPPDVSDLEVERKDLADEDNALTYIEKAIEARTWFYDGNAASQQDVAVNLGGWLRGEVSIAPELLTKTLEENQAVFDWIERAAACDYFQSPLPQSTDDDTWSSIDYAALTPMLIAKARWDYEQGDFDEASNFLIKANWMASTVEGQATDFLGQRAGSLMSMALVQEMMRLAKQSQAPLQTVRRLFDNLEKRLKRDWDSSNFIKASYQVDVMWVDDIAGSPTDRHMVLAFPDDPDLPEKLKFLETSFYSYRFHPNRTKRLYADMTRQYLGPIPSTYEASKKKGLFDYGGYHTDITWVEMLKPNSSGQHLPSRMFSVPYALRQYYLNLYQMRAQYTALAVWVYYKEQNKFPSSLKDLENGVLEKVPLDPYDGMPLRYDPSELVIYTVGPDLIDDPNGRRARRILIMGPKESQEEEGSK